MGMRAKKLPQVPGAFGKKPALKALPISGLSLGILVD
jgi:hypothetical protein